MHFRAGLSLIEVMTAVSLATFIAAIGFTGVNAFGKSITRAKQFTSETEMITAAIRIADEQAEAAALLPVGTMQVPRGWTTCDMQSDRITFEIQVKEEQTGGHVKKGLNMDSAGQNVLIVKALSCYKL